MIFPKTIIHVHRKLMIDVKWSNIFIGNSEKFIISISLMCNFNTFELIGLLL